jgi:FkbM family methyltransferase
MLIDRPDEYIQSAILNEGAYEAGIVDLLRQGIRPSDTLFDVGANLGQYALLAGALGARAHAFEPVPRLAACTERHVRRNRLESRVRVVRWAAGRECGTARFHVNARDDDGSHSLVPGIEAKGVEILHVRTTTIDAYSRALGVTPTIVKIDVEGAEALVLDGMDEVLDRVPGPTILIETADRLADQIGESARSVLDRLVRRGYRVFVLEERRPCGREVTLTTVDGRLRNYLCARPGTHWLSLPALSGTDSLPLPSGEVPWRAR